MGKVKQGINGPFTGKVGSVVGIDYNGVGVMRSLPSRRSKPFTPQELQQQAKFRLTSQFLEATQGIVESHVYANPHPNLRDTEKHFRIISRMPLLVFSPTCP